MNVKSYETELVNVYCGFQVKAAAFLCFFVIFCNITWDLSGYINLLEQCKSHVAYFEITLKLFSNQESLSHRLLVVCFTFYIFYHNSVSPYTILPYHHVRRLLLCNTVPGVDHQNLILGPQTWNRELFFSSSLSLQENVTALYVRMTHPNKSITKSKIHSSILRQVSRSSMMQRVHRCMQHSYKIALWSGACLICIDKINVILILHGFMYCQRQRSVAMHKMPCFHY